MGIFGKKHEKEFKELHNDNLFGDDDDVLLPAYNRNTTSKNVGNGNIHAPHAITPDELSGNKRIETIPMKHTETGSVYKQMKEREQKTNISAMEDDYTPSWATSSVPPETKSQAESKKIEPTASEPSVKETVNTTVSKQPSIDKIKPHPAFSDAFLERCRNAVEKASENDETAARRLNENTESVSSQNSENAPVKKPGNATRSCDEIIRMLRGKTDSSVEAVNEASPEVFADSSVDAKNNSENMHDITDRKVEVEIIPTDSDSDIMHTASSSNLDSDMRVYGKIVKGTVIQQTPDGDVEGTEFVKPKVTQDTIIADDKTIMFGNLGDVISKRADDDFTASKFDSQDNRYDDDDDYLDDTPYYETEDPLLADIDDYKTLNDSAELLTKFIAEKSRNKILTVFSFVAVAIMLLLATPFLKMLSASNLGLINFIVLAATLLVNYDIFSDFKKFVSKRLTFDSATALISTVLLIQVAVSTFMFSGKYNGFEIAGVVLIAANRFAHLLKVSRILKGLKIIANSEDKRAIISVDGKNAKIIASGAVQSEAIVLCDRKALNIKNFIKSSNYLSPIDLKVNTLIIISTSISLVALLVVGFLANFGLGLTVASAVLTCMFPATAIFTCELPMYFAAKKADSYGAMLAGYKGAYELNLANLVAVSSSDLFPEGSVSLYNMKTLSENEIGKTLLDAGAVSKAANSPLSSIFESIIGADYKINRPKVNGVQYEDKMGISGWIDERTILIGNRNLMQGHNVSVPPASVDQKILRAGYFPVYIAIDGVPCLLLIVKYDTDPEVTAELQALCNTGMTVVVDPKDPNTSSAMICDYFGLPDDALKVMNHNGRVTYEHTAAYSENCSAPAVFGKNICGFFASVTSSIKLNSTYRILTAIFVIVAILGGVSVITLAVASKLNLINTLTVGVFQLLGAAISAIIAKVRS